MARIGISITKECAFRDSVQPFSNVYFYQDRSIGGAVSETEAGNAIDTVVTFEKSVHGNDVTFTYGRCWWQTSLNATTTMLNQKTLSGVGAAADFAFLDRERAFLFRWPAGVDSRGNPVFLRKWYHTCGAFASLVPPGQTQLENKAALEASFRTAAETKVQDIATISIGGTTFHLCSKTGRDYENVRPVAHHYLEHHQLGDQWRGD